MSSADAPDAAVGRFEEERLVADLPTVGLMEWVSRVCDGNRTRVGCFLEPEPAIAIYKKAIAALTDEANKELLIGVLKNPEFAEDPVRRAHKFELTMTKVMKAALAEFGFKAGIDAKKAMRQLDLEIHQNEGVKAISEEYVAALNAFEEDRAAAHLSDHRKLSRPPPGAAPASASASLAST